MITDPNKDWKLQVIDSLDDFCSTAGKGYEAVADHYLQDDGQQNLTWEAIKQFMPTVEYKLGDEITAFELGKIVGHWVCLFQDQHSKTEALVDLGDVNSYLITLRDNYAALEHNEPAKDKIPKDLQPIILPYLELMIQILNPDGIEGAASLMDEFAAVHRTVLDFANLQNSAECDDFNKGYYHALSSPAFDQNCEFKNPDKVATILAAIRPMAIQVGMPASKFQNVVDLMSGAQVTGSPEAFAKRLYRQKASLRGKGRPPKNPSD